MHTVDVGVDVGMREVGFVELEVFVIVEAGRVVVDVRVEVRVVGDWVVKVVVAVVVTGMKELMITDSVMVSVVVDQDQTVTWSVM